MKGLLVLADGTYYKGECFGKPGETTGELIFNTCMTGYQEILTDPSYKGQIVTMTYPLIGNYGINSYDCESDKTHLEGLVVREYCKQPSNYRSIMDIEQFFTENNLLGISGVDTRAITQHIRKNGSMGAVISTCSTDIGTLADKAKAYSLKGKDLASQVTTKKIIHKKNTGPKVAVLDLGIKNSIVKTLYERNCHLYILPAQTPAQQIVEFDADGLLISNGPGEPEGLRYAVDTISNLIGKISIMGIGLGHQLIALALKGKIHKLKFGHHGTNYPVKNIKTGKIHITCQSHNYAVDFDDQTDIEITHINVNDNTIEGFKHKKYPIISLQYHPKVIADFESSHCIFDEFIDMMKN
ncbi:MAG: glutamine-hydrolyzing carbamoyl-phosphate synthase small subunit [Clostridia bacterium]|nr:glutamine-hydrolyzing carbamoyl-phosphate synthase small subunit [Clostridia bacterium]